MKIKKVDVYVRFPTVNDFYKKNLNKVAKYCGSIEQTEQAFNIEFSCGDGKYLSDIEDNEEDLEKYDGEVSTEFPPIDCLAGVEFIPNKAYRFTIIYFPNREESVFYINSKERSRRREE